MNTVHANPALLGHAGSGLLWKWELDPLVLVSLALAAFFYQRGLSRLWCRAGVGAGVKRWEAIAFWCGWATLSLSLVSPLHAWGNQLFAAHMTQHELLMLIAAPLIVLGRPLPIMLIALPPGLARDVARWSRSSVWTLFWRKFSNAFAAWLLHAVILWVWHIPVLFQAAVDDRHIHALQHASFFGSAVLFWWSAMQGARAAGYGAAVLYMFTTAMHSGLLGAMITFAGSVWYPGYEQTAPAWGLTALEDQQLGGLIMWVPACLVYIVAALALLAGWMRESERRTQQWQSRAAGIRTGA